MENMNESHVIMKRHAVCIPYPAQGHVTPMLKLAKLLNATHNFHISFVNTVHNHRRLLHSHGASGVSGLQSFRFHFISDGLPPAENPNATQDIPALCKSINQTGAHAFRDLLSNLNSAGDVPPVSCVVADAAMPFAVDVAEELGLPVVRFWTASACGLWGYAQYECLVQKGIIPLPAFTYSIRLSTSSQILSFRLEDEGQQKMMKRVLQKLNSLFWGSDDDYLACRLDRVIDLEMFFLVSMYFSFSK